ncbi:Os02g0556050, partial [Oryza sativa Japonica Group]
ADVPARVGDGDPPVAVGEVGRPRLGGVPPEQRLLALVEQAEPLERRRHGVVRAPPPRVRLVAGELPELRRVPVAVVVAEAEPRLHPDEVDGEGHGGLRGEHGAPGGGEPLAGVPLPEVLHEVGVRREAVPPREDLVEVPLVAAVVGVDVGDVVHEQAERAAARLHHHHAGVEQRAVVRRRAHLGHGEERRHGALHQQVGVEEDDAVVLRQRPQPELAVVPLVVRVRRRARVADAPDRAHLPPGRLQRAAVARADRLVHERHHVALRLRRRPGGGGHPDALRRH